MSGRYPALLVISLSLFSQAVCQAVAGPIPGVTPALCASGGSCQPLLIQPTADPNYVPCVQHPGKDCVQGSKVVALAPFDATEACPTVAFMGTLLTQKSIEDQVCQRARCGRLYSLTRDECWQVPSPLQSGETAIHCKAGCGCADLHLYQRRAAEARHLCVPVSLQLCRLAQRRGVPGPRAHGFRGHLGH